MKKLLVMTLFVSASLFASSGAEHGATDILPRTVNFLIFAGILWYLLAKPVKGFFTGRAGEIADRLNSIQEKLRASEAEKTAAEARVEEAKTFAAELTATTEKEKEVLKKQIEVQSANEIAVLEKQMKDKENLAERQMVRGVVETVLSDVTAQSTASLDKEKMADIIMKKVA
ncbi:F0F1 ATP synthase subunit B [Sulfurimonas sp. HSL-3221]|uniref:F0F1 ATP synthase subunit B n=1 Tax=Sulfurimonadaceae TaxID=2771471 RepID=UPI001E3A3FF6|nr:F0F1 ATP synthase subunit B [Sulfurimonas sp. HSL-3221]UFS63317.1 F0F1 ATP synthase subunit B [Sulfurimonas sp. HSL-3221]